MPRIDAIQIKLGAKLVMTAPTGTFANNKLAIPAPVWVGGANTALITIVNKDTEKFKVTGNQMDGHTMALPQGRNSTAFSKAMSPVKLAKTGPAEFKI